MLGKKQEHDLCQSRTRICPAMGEDGGRRRPLPLGVRPPGTWSQKYNLVWDKVLGFHLFPAEVAEKEVAYYEIKGHFGFPLDNRQDYTKLDWEFWSATLADSAADWERLISPIYDWTNRPAASP